MKKLLLFLALGVLGLCSQAFAAGITGFSVTPTADEKSLHIKWDPVAAEVASQTNGYAIQWSIYETNMRTDKLANQWLRAGRQDLVLRAGGFERNKDYYFRIYTYQKEGRRRILTNGSKIIKWQWKTDGTVESSEIEPNDPTPSSSSNSSSSGTTDTFTALRTSRYDNFIDFRWSRARKLTSSDYHGFHIVLSKNSDLSDPVAILETERSTYAGRITGLTPGTQYYAKGYFFKNRAGETQRFGGGTMKPVKTIKAIDRTKSTRASRNIKKIERKSLKSVDAGEPTTNSTTSADDSNSDTTSTTSEDTSSSSGSSTSTKSSSSSGSTTSTINTSVSSSASKAAINKKIAEVKKEIKRLQKELRSLQAKLRKKSSRRSSRTSSTKKTTTRKRKRSYSNFMDAYKKSAYRR